MSLAKTFPASLIVADKAGAQPHAPLKGRLLRVFQTLYFRLEMLARDKHSCFLRTFTNAKSIIALGPGKIFES